MASFFPYFFFFKYFFKGAINKRIHSSGPQMTCSWEIQLQAWIHAEGIQDCKEGVWGERGPRGE